MKLPKGIKRLRVAASEDALAKAIDLASNPSFNGYIRTTAPKGVKEASVIIFVEGTSRVAVFQSPQRSLYGPDALHEVRRISGDTSSTIRVEEFLAQNMEEVNGIVSKMRKAHIKASDVDEYLMGEGLDEAPEAAKAPEDIEGEEEVEEEEEEPEPDEEGVEDEGPPPKAGGIRAKVTERITRSQESAAHDDEFLRMMKEAGMTPPGDEDAVEDEVDQYIAAFEDFLQRSGDEAAPADQETVRAQVTNAIDDIMDEMLEAASDDPEMMQFIESQRERVLSKVSTFEPTDTARERHGLLMEQQVALEEISSTFREVLKASEAEAEGRRKKLDKLLDEEAGDTEIEREALELEQAEERQTGLQSILKKVLETHRERLESAAEEAMDEEEEEIAASRAEEDKTRQELDLEGAKEQFLKEMRSRIQTVSRDNGASPAPGKVADAVKGVSEDLHDRVEELELEQDVLTRERKQLEDETRALSEKVDTMEVDLEVEVQARLRDLEAKEGDLRARLEESQELERRLGDERNKVNKDLEHAQSELRRVEEMEKKLADREKLLTTREKELEGKHTEVDGLKEHLEEEIAQRASELEEMERGLKGREAELEGRAKEITGSIEQLKKEREMGVESDIKRIQEMEAELKRREEEYSSTIDGLNSVIEALREELRSNIENMESMDAEIKALRETERRVAELEEQMASMPEEGPEVSGMDKEELRKLLAYLDDLLSKLPEKEIEKFSKTEYFELYGRILDKLGI